MDTASGCKSNSLQEPLEQDIAQGKDASKHLMEKPSMHFRAQAGIEPVIGHIKHDRGMMRNYLSVTLGDNPAKQIQIMGRGKFSLVFIYLIR